MNNGKICVSVSAETTDEFIKNIERAEKFADVIELRFDCLNEIESEKLWNGIKKVRGRFNGQLLATFRSFEQGGKKNLNFEERKDFWADSHISELFDLIDFEPDFSGEGINNSFSRIIKSFHDFNGIPENLPEIYNQLSAGSNLLKIVAQANDVTDSIPIWKLLERAQNDNKRIIPIAMSEAGKWTRILGLAYGAFMTYASLDTGSETAPGQVSALDLIEVYRAKELDEQTEVYGIIGNPVSQSVSPYMHNAAFKFYRLNAVYLPFEVKDLNEFINRMVKPETREIDINICGFSVTIPHKQAIIEHLDFIDDTARTIGAVNTVKIVDGKLYGSNTDAKGFIEPLRKAYGNLKNVKVTVLGSGGAARAAIYALKNDGADITILARNTEKAAQLGKDFQVNFNDLNNQHSVLNTSKILVNTTPLGMKGKTETETPVTADLLENVKLIYDLIYNPFETRLIQEARKIGVPTIGGLAMLVAQGMEQFKIWTGKDAPMKEMSAAGLKKLR